MTAIKEKSLSEMKQQEYELGNEIKKMSEQLTFNHSESAMDEYRILLNKRTQIKNDIERYQREKWLNTHKRPLPQAPDAYLGNKYYFDKKAELNQREDNFKDKLAELEFKIEKLHAEHDTAVLSGTDEEIGKLYDQLQNAKKDKAIAESNIQSLENSKQRVLDDAAIQVFQSRMHIGELFEDERAALMKRYDEVQRKNIKAMQEEIKNYNARYDREVNSILKVFQDLGDNSGLGFGLFQKYSPQPESLNVNYKINIGGAV